MMTRRERKGDLPHPLDEAQAAAAGLIYSETIRGTESEKRILQSVSNMIAWSLELDETHSYSANDELSYPRTAPYCDERQDVANALGLSGFPMIWRKAIIATHHMVVPDDDGGSHVYVTIRAEDLSWNVRVHYTYYLEEPSKNDAILLKTWGVDYSSCVEWFANAERQIAAFRNM